MASQCPTAHPYLYLLCSKQTQRHFWSVLSCSKKHLIRAYCKPMYACQLLSKYTQTNMKSLRAAYNNAYRIMHHIPRNVSVSDARLFCKNKQENLKNKPKIGNLSEKQAQYALAGKFNKTKNQQENYIRVGRQIRKNKPKMSKFS